MARPPSRRLTNPGHRRAIDIDRRRDVLGFSKGRSIPRATDAVACTLVAKPNLAHARVLAASWREQHPKVPVRRRPHGRPEGCFAPAREPYEVVELARMPFTGNAELRFRHRQQELSYAASTRSCSSTCSAASARRVLFFKQESLVLAPHATSRSSC